MPTGSRDLGSESDQYPSGVRCSTGLVCFNVCVCVRVCRCVVVWKFICWSEAKLANLVVFSAEIPPPDVVLYTKGLYERGGKDVRFLIPVMKGLSKVQCVSAVN